MGGPNSLRCSGKDQRHCLSNVPCCIWRRLWLLPQIQSDFSCCCQLRLRHTIPFLLPDGMQKWRYQSTRLLLCCSSCFSLNDRRSIVVNRIWQRSSTVIKRLQIQFLEVLWPSSIYVSHSSDISAASITYWASTILQEVGRARQKQSAPLKFDTSIASCWDICQHWY